MCDTCGCGNNEEKAVIRIPGEKPEEKREHQHHEHVYSHSHEHGSDHHHHHHGDHYHTHDHHSEHGTTVIPVETDILMANNLLAERNRGIFEARNITVINIMSSPGSGKTTLLERTVKELKDEISFFIIEGDQQTMNDAERIKATGVPVVQINTGRGCHLDAEMINRAVKKLAPADGSFLLIENVGNLVCPSLFDLGETHRVLIMSVTEGEDKPIKYPDMFRSVSLCLLNKCDLLPHLTYDLSLALKYNKQVNPKLHIMQLSALSGEGTEEWYKWLRECRNNPDEDIF